MKLLKVNFNGLWVSGDYSLINKTRKSRLNGVVIHHLGIPVDLQLLAVLETLLSAYRRGLVKDVI